MINTLNDLVKAIFAILPFICLCLLSRGVNLDKPFRYRQFLMPIFAVDISNYVFWTFLTTNNYYPNREYTTLLTNRKTSQ